MACMTHLCTKCDWEGFDNHSAATCPLCGARCTNQFDEQGDDDLHHTDDGEYYSDDERDWHDVEEEDQ